MTKLNKVCADPFNNFYLVNVNWPQDHYQHGNNDILINYIAESILVRILYKNIHLPGHINECKH